MSKKKDILGLHPELSILGEKVNFPTLDLEVFDCPDSVVEVEFETDELTSNCPKTGQPDFYTLVIRYIPNKKCIESKALKLYLWTYRDSGQFCEELSKKILDDVVQACQPKFAEIKLKMAPRGGITIQSRAKYSEPIVFTSSTSN